MKIHVEDTINFPRDVVFTTYRDELDQLATYLPNIDKIEVKEREELDNGSVRLLNIWKASPAEIPSIVRPFIDPSKIAWNDYALWNANDHTCEWRNELNVFTEHVSIRGKNRFEPAGDNAVKIIINGELTVDAKKIPGVPRLLAGRIGPAIEKFVVTLITPNLKEVNRGLEKFIASKQG
ncbi:MAG: hypothetical protein CMH57_09045 [Myxococcales bacterium]|nr:hypothetical protein [Myxococcales bacterium]